MKKVYILLFFFCFGYVVIGVRYMYVVFLAPYVAQEQSPEYVRRYTYQAQRGSILDAQQRPLVLSMTTYDLILDPQLFPQKSLQRLFVFVEKILGQKVTTSAAKLKSGSARYAKVASHLMASQQAKIRESFTEPGIFFETDHARLYPEASLAAKLHGFLGKDHTGNTVGYYGIEGYYDIELKGLDGVLQTERDIFGRPLVFGIQNAIPNQDGRDLVLTIDAVVQAKAKEKLRAGVERYGAKEGCVTIADPHTMAILVMTCLPDYDPQRYAEFVEPYFRNQVVSDTYEPGSTFKPLIVAAAIESEMIRLDEELPEYGPITIGEYSIKTWNDEYAGKPISISTILEHSSNVGMVEIGRKLGNDTLYKNIIRFGFGELTGIDLQGEAKGVIKDRLYWYPIDYATATFGQGIAVTQIQLLTAFASIINGGELLQPYIVKSFVDGTNIRHRAERKVVRRTISESTSAVMRRLLINTVEKGEYRYAIPKGYVFGGKTGTAQIAFSGSYDSSKTVASFIGFAPAEDPQFIGIVTIKEPSVSEWGSTTAAPLFFDIAEDIIAYYRIPRSD